MIFRSASLYKKNRICLFYFNVTRCRLASNLFICFSVTNFSTFLKVLKSFSNILIGSDQISKVDLGYCTKLAKYFVCKNELFLIFSIFQELYYEIYQNGKKFSLHGAPFISLQTIFARKYDKTA